MCLNWEMTKIYSVYAMLKRDKDDISYIRASWIDPSNGKLMSINFLLSHTACKFTSIWDFLVVYAGNFAGNILPFVGMVNN